MPVLLAAAASVDLLVVVVGSRGHGLLLGTMGGSVSQYVARHAICPVVVVRPMRQPGAQQIVVGIDGSDGARAALQSHAADAASGPPSQEASGEREGPPCGYLRDRTLDLYGTSAVAAPIMAEVLTAVENVR